MCTPPLAVIDPFLVDMLGHGGHEGPLCLLCVKCRRVHQAAVSPGKHFPCHSILPSLSLGRSQYNSARQCQGRLLLGSARAGMCCCCGCCPLLAHSEQGPLQERVSVGRWKAGTRATGVCMGSGAEEGKGHWSPFLAPVPRPFPLPAELSRQVAAQGTMRKDSVYKHTLFGVALASQACCSVCCRSHICLLACRTCSYFLQVSVLEMAGRAERWREGECMWREEIFRLGL